MALNITVKNTAVMVGGDVLIASVEQADWAKVNGEGIATIDISHINRLDTAGAWCILSLQDRLAAQGAPVEITGATDLQAGLLDTVRDNMPTEAPDDQRHFSVRNQLETLGRGTVATVTTTTAILGFLGQVIVTLVQQLRHPSRIRWTATVHHMQQVGLNAVPIVVLMAFLIGVVLAFQGSVQLQQFGAEVFVVDLIAISILRELGILLTAIIVAGRSGSAFTAAIGSMKMREEIDAMRTLGLDPIEVLVVPRVIAMILTLPVLGVIANASGLIGGALMSWIELGVSPGVFQTRFINNTDVWHFGVGMIKAPFFALIIGIVGCYEGTQVGGDAESLGQKTSASVVLAIFLVITTDALFSIFFALVGV